MHKDKPYSWGDEKCDKTDLKPEQCEAKTSFQVTNTGAQFSLSKKKSLKRVKT